MTIGNERNSRPQAEVALDANDQIDMSPFEQATVSQFEVKRDNLSDIRHNLASFSVFAEMMARKGREFDEV